MTNTRSFRNVFVDCVVLGCLKPTKLCRMVKIMLQIAITLFSDNADIKYVSGYVLFFPNFHCFSQMTKDIVIKMMLCS